MRMIFLKRGNEYGKWFCPCFVRQEQGYIKDMATGEITREEMIAFIRGKNEFYRNVDLSALTWEELTQLWETTRAAWLLGK